MFAKKLNPGDLVIFTVTKRNAHPGPRAKEIDPARHGDDYLFIVDKYWIVNERRGSQLSLMTRRGKVHLVDENDPRLHTARWWERLLYKNRFPKLPATSEPSDPPANSPTAPDA